MKFTFKTDKPTGRYRAFYPSQHHIKFKGVQVGSIGDEPPYKIRLMVLKTDDLDDKNPNCDWMWITLKKESETLSDAKEFLNTNIDLILQKYNLKIIN